MGFLRLLGTFNGWMQLGCILYTTAAYDDASKIGGVRLRVENCFFFVIFVDISDD